ncbi:MAG TPA: sulfurtransferase complex subunit TusB [Thiolapillus brandeum]|uniref:Sulfurtransferase complex subunit TusB n=1 Tax=Thiolapillus brandeum TaxID=1076588 RepID=A0A831K3E4_9GAMM|nr:sulfurtransferase complex subunit TusB [Thiolapillus brandeum]
MSDLHTVNKSPFEKNSLESCLRLSKAGSAILLYEDGVYAALKGTAVENMIASAVSDKKVYVLGPDYKARGLADDRIIDGVEVVDYAGFVDLVEANDKVQAWV